MKNNDTFDMTALSDDIAKEIGERFPDMTAAEVDRIYGKTMAKVGGTVDDDMADSVTGTERAVRHSWRGFAAAAAAVVVMAAGIPALMMSMRNVHDSDTEKPIDKPNFTIVDATEPSENSEKSEEKEAPTEAAEELPTEAENCLRPVPEDVTKPAAVKSDDVQQPVGNVVNPKVTAKKPAVTNAPKKTTAAAAQTTAATTVPAVTTTKNNSWINEMDRYMTIKEVAALNGMDGKQINLTVGGCGDFYFETDGKEIRDGKRYMTYRLPIQDNYGLRDRFTLHLTEGPDFNYVSAILYDNYGHLEYDIMGLSYTMDDIKGLAYENDHSVMTLKDIVELNEKALAGTTITLADLSAFPYDEATYEIRPNSTGYRFPVADANGETMRYYVVAEYYGGGRSMTSLAMVDMEKHEYHSILTEDLSYLYSGKSPGAWIGPPDYIDYPSVDLTDPSLVSIREEMIKNGRLPADTPRVKKDQFLDIFNEANYIEFASHWEYTEYVMDKLNEICGAPDYNYGSGLDYHVYIFSNGKEGVEIETTSGKIQLITL